MSGGGLLVVLTLIVAAGGVLGAAVVAGQPQWAWGSVVLSVLAGVLLLAGRFRDRGARSRGGPPPHPAGSVERAEPAEGDPDAEPAEEDTDAIDPPAVSDLEATVVVIDERPRYHLQRCSWLGERETLPLPVWRARELDFTPCARCAPDATLLAAAREPSEPSWQPEK
ncbi:hypothetical protein FHX42_000757 [Saccharopolyspora lacisalsi]|uniref:Uncharacterized protein n=1 Tax=Halosaccharopolyspora lacisalsi TaxID=1000566 RepID=A0A839DXG3_9PSEU|nr:hypothetical protein [Halosaccharopolyspora lacisalsi]MBA8823428.1 hypothetical protein [Halosaccharopolyspora lacisalsi]